MKFVLYVVFLFFFSATAKPLGVYSAVQNENRFVIQYNSASKDYTVVKVPSMNDRIVMYEIKNTFFAGEKESFYGDSEIIASSTILQTGPDSTRVVFELKDSHTRFQDRIKSFEDKIVFSFSPKITFDYVPVVVIDAGHGGKDPGAVNGKIYEKDIVFEFSKKLHDRFSQMENIKAYLTRTTDMFIPLKDRIKLAKELYADIFISVHVDSVSVKKCSGFGVYYLSKNGATDANTRRLAEKENNSDFIGGISMEESPEIYSILMDLEQTNTIKESAILAGMIKNSITDGNVKFHTVSQAEFAVLKSLDVPSVLLELGFISNDQERKMLVDKTYQNKLVELIADAVYNYLFEKYIPSKKMFKLSGEPVKVRKELTREKEDKSLKYLSQ